jgi:peroxiredoxin Q/BCP
MAKKARRTTAAAKPTAKPSAVKRAGKSARTTKPATTPRRSPPTRPAAAAKGKTGASAAPKRAPPAKAAPDQGWLAVGAPAPDFTLPTHDGGSLSLASLRGKPVVIYFYPKDDTPGCTVEACGFRDAMPRLGRHRAVVLGISADGPASHARFRAKYKLPFTLLADEDHAVADRFGAWREKSLYGRTFMGIARSTFIIDAAGRVAAVFTKVKPDVHADEVLEALVTLA